MEVLIGVILVSYIGLNIYVAKRINDAEYLYEGRKSLHKRLIWYLPFIGPLIIRSFWDVKPKNADDIVTKDKRKIKQGKHTDNWQRLTGYGRGVRF